MSKLLEQREDIKNMSKREAVQILRGLKVQLKRKVAQELTISEHLCPKNESTLNVSVHDSICNMETLMNQYQGKVRRLELQLIQAKRQHFEIEEHLEETILQWETNVSFLAEQMQREQELSKEIKKGLNTITQHKFQEMEEQIVEHSSPHPKPVNKLSLLKKIFVRKVK